MSTVVTVNSIIVTEMPDGTLLRERILWIDNEGYDCYTIDIDGEKALPVYRRYQSILEGIEEKELFLEVIDPYLKIIHEDDIPIKHKNRRDKNWTYIQDAVSFENEPDIYNDKIRWRIIKEICNNHGKLHPMTLYKYLRRYWQRGKIVNALIPDYEATGVKERNYTEKKPGRSSINSEYESIPLTNEVKSQFDLVLNQYYKKEGYPTLTHVYKQLIKRFYTDIILRNGKKEYIVRKKKPSFWQLKHYNATYHNTSEDRKKRIGSRKFQLSERPVLGSSIVKGPGACYQIDSTKSNVYLVSRLNPGHIVGRATVYYVIDVFSREVAGLYIGLEEPSWVGAMMALANASMNKVTFCKEYGIDITPDMWRAQHMPRLLRTDRGSEYISKNIEPYLLAFSTEFDNTPSYRADLKGIVEQYIYRAEEKIKPLVPGYVHRDADERGTPDYRKGAALTIEDYTTIIIEGILNYNQNHWFKEYPVTKEMVMDEVKPIPNDLWSWGISKNNGILRTFPEEVVKFNLLPLETARVTKKGIKFKNMYYSCKYAEEEDWYYRANSETWTTKVSYDPRLTDYIYIHLGDGKYDTCTLTPSSTVYKGLTFAEAKITQKAIKEGWAKHEPIELQGDINLIARIEEKVEEAEKRKGDNQIRGVTTEDIIPHRAAEKEVERKERVFLLDNNATYQEVDETPKEVGREVTNHQELEEDDDEDIFAHLQKLQEERLR